MDAPPPIQVGGNLHRRLLLRAITVAAGASAISVSSVALEPVHRDGAVRIRFVVADGTPISGLLLGVPAARDFAAMLPLTLTLTDYAATEKIGDLPRRLTTVDAPDGFEPAAGDIAFYAPWGNLAIFHKAFRYSPKLVRLGQITGGIERLALPGPVQVTIERVD